jgi:mono/diheme cytochrome c family protein
MKRYLVAMVLLAAGLAGAVAFFFWPAGLDPVAPSPSQPTGDALLARGEYLTEAADCVACHTAPGGRPFAGGRAFQLPFGTIYAPNITPDRETGLGAWSDAEFVRAVRRGVGRHGEDLYPAFPYTSYSLISDDDALAIRAYLANLAPIRSPATENTLIFPFNQRYLMRSWKLLFLSSRRFELDTSRSAGWNRGAYLARALAHCGECHTPRNLFLATRRRTRRRERKHGGGCRPQFAPSDTGRRGSTRRLSPLHPAPTGHTLGSCRVQSSGFGCVQPLGSARRRTRVARRADLRRLLRELPWLGRQRTAGGQRSVARCAHRQRPRRNQSCAGDHGRDEGRFTGW